MKLRGIEFGPVFTSSGARGFFGEGYWYHDLPFMKQWLNFSDTTFIAKTTTLEAREGNMPLDHQYRPLGFIPSCIVVKPLQGAVLNAVGLSGPGADALLSEERWQQRTEPFFISFMSVKETVEERLEELEGFVRLLKPEIPRFKTKIGLEMNFSCPNVGLHHAGQKLYNEISRGLRIASALNIPLIPNLNAQTEPEVAFAIVELVECDALSIANGIGFGLLPELIDWEKIFGPNGSPLSRYGGGALSGKPLLKVTLDWLMRARISLKGKKLPKPLIIGGGITSSADVHAVLNAGVRMVQGIKLGVAPMVRPWNVPAIIREMKSMSPPSH